MKRPLLYVSWAFGVVLCFLPYIITSHLYLLEGPEWTANWEGSGFAQKRMKYISGFLVSIPLSAFYIYATRAMVRKLAFDLAQIQRKGIVRNLEIIFVLAIVVFVASGGLAFLSVFINHSRIELYKPMELGLTPVAIFLIVIGLMGVTLLILAPKNFQNGSKRLARIQLYAGFIFLLISYGSFELLWRLVS